MSKLKRMIDRHLSLNGLNQVDLAQKLNCKPDRLSKWLLERVKVPFDEVSKISEVLSLSRMEQVELYSLAGYEMPGWVKESLGGGPLDSGGVEITVFPTGKEFFRFVSNAISEADTAVDDVTWSVDVPSITSEEEEAYQEYLGSIRKACERGVRFREVMTFETYDYVERAKDLIENQALITYNLGTYETKLRSEDVPPLLSFVVIDSHTVAFGYYRYPVLPHEDEIRLAIRNHEIAGLFKDYFKTVWHKAIKIKEGDKLDSVLFDKIKAKFPKKQDLSGDENTSM